jgi:branched-chain amino acid transport system substrate-binding protein
MQIERLRRLLRPACLVALAAASSGCNSVTGLSDFSVQEQSTEPVAECETNRQCSEKLGQAAACVRPDARCVALLSEDCDAVTGNPNDEPAILLGSLFSTQGAQAATNKERQRAAMLAVMQINAVGGVPTPGGTFRKLVLVSCNETVALTRAGEHLRDLGVPAIVGPNTSQDTLNVSQDVTIPAGIVVMTPTAVASSIGALVDDNLTWLMVPNDEQRAPLMLSQINQLEERITTARGGEVKLSIVSRGDALGTGTRTSLNSLRLNGQPLSGQINKTVLIDEYDFTKPEQNAVVTRHLAFEPDIVVLAGTAEAITFVMKPLEEQWPAGTPRPEYVLIDSVKVPELTTLATNNDDLRHRIRGTGIVPGGESIEVNDSFKTDYQVAFMDGNPNISGMGPSYDAVYSMAYAIAANGNEPVSGAAIAANLSKLAGGPTLIHVGSRDVTKAFARLTEGSSIDAVGTFGRLEWDENGAVLGGTLEMWCIGASGGTPAYRSSGLNFDLKTKVESGEYVQCAP